MTIDRKHLVLPLLLALAACGGADSESAVRTGSADLISLEESAPAQGAASSADVALSRGVESGVPQAAPDRARGNGEQVGEVQVLTDPAVTPTTTGTRVDPSIPVAPGSVSLDPMIIRTGTANVQVDSLDQGIAQVRALAARVGGIIGNTSISGGTDQERHASIELRVPSQNFDAALTGLQPIGKVQNVNVTAQDVGEEYADVTARVANARRLEARLLDLLDRRTGRLEEILNLEREVARVREEIERYEGRLRYLRTRASISTLTITLHEPNAVIGTPRGERPIRDAFGIAWRNFVGLIAGLIAATGLLIPLAIVLYGAWRVWNFFRRREAERDAIYRENIRRARASAPDEPAHLP
ncbi:DUF4349 domain-containing protein [Longimicrobium sp.]|jgi:hypothetical protein|uniref:DUF4349 domain-containing protein n=1 Tax=Longimicrobium sp. TaxID=2029185 RepID=UPI002F9463AE